MTVHQTGHDLDGKLLWDVMVIHVYTTDESGLVTRMEIVDAE